MVAVIQKKAFKPGVWKGWNLTADKLRNYAESTNRAIAAGVKIPALNRHTKVTDGDEELSKVAAGTDGAGWVKRIDFDAEDGTLGWEIDVPQHIKDGIDNKTIRFTSPQFRETYKAHDIPFEGPIIRHVAFTPVPTLQSQGDLAVAMSEGVFQFGEDDYEGPPKKDGDGDGKTGEGDDADGEADDKPADDAAPKNPDIPTTATDKTKLEAVRACLSQMGAELASDWDWASPGGPDQLLACLKTLAKAKSEADAESQQQPQEPELKESQDGMPFSEDDIKALPEPMQAKARKANADAKEKADQVKQFSEERKATTREKAIAAVQSAKLPKGLKDRLVDRFAAVQFSETAELPTLTIQDAAAMFAEAVPELAEQFDETPDDKHPDGAAFFKVAGGKETEQEAEALADRIFGKQPAKKAG